MKTSRYYLLPALAAVLLAPSALAQKEVTIRRLDKEGAPPGFGLHGAGGPMETERVAFLGVDTAPVNRTLAAQLGLARDTGLVVAHIADKSPAVDVLKEDDVLTKLDDQILINQQQLAVLVRGRKDGEEVKLTVVRGGKETVVKTKLATREVPKLAGNFPGASGNNLTWTLGGPAGGVRELRGLPGMDDDRARDVLRLIGREHQGFMARPSMRIVRNGERGTTILDLPNSNIAYSDEVGAVEIKAEDGKRELTVKDAQGKITFQGPVNSEEERKKLPPEVLERLKKLDEGSISFEADEVFEHKMLPMPPEPTKTKVRHEPGSPGRPALRPL